MALFSRRKKDDAPAPAAPAAAAVPPTDAAPSPNAQPADAVPIGAGPDGAPPPDDAPAAASVGISLSSFQGVGAPAPPAARPRSVPPAAEPALAEAPPATETVPGLRDNVLLREALRALPPEPAPREALNVARQLLQGHVFLRVKGDARTLLAAGSDLPLAVAGQGDAQLVLIYSSGEALQASLRADGDTDTSAVGQPALSVLRLVLRGPYAGVLIDHASPPARLLLPRDLLQRALDDAHPEAAIKTLLAAPRTDSTANAVVAAMPDAPLWIAANRAADDQRMGIAESRSSGGDRFIEVFTHPLEVLALGRGDRPVPVRAAQLGAALAADDGLSGLVFDPAGPWLRVTRADLLPIIALAP